MITDTPFFLQTVNSEGPRNDCLGFLARDGMLSPMKFFLLAALFALSVCCAEEEVALPQLYTFQNGLGFGDDQEEAAELSALGYAGVSQVSGTVDELREMVAVYTKQGLRVRSIYMDAGDLPVNAAKLEVLAPSGAMVELTVRKMSTETVESVQNVCDVAQKLGMKVVLYPHHGFAVATIPQAMNLIAKVSRPNLGVMFNLCHFLRGENSSDLEKVITEAGDKLFAVSVSGAEVDGKNWGALIKPLDEGDFPLSNLLGILEKKKFQGPISLQCYGVPGDKRKNLERSMAAWKKLGE